MNLRQLEAFRATIRCGSITGAAKMLHISQPSVSRLIADLEHSTGFALFTRAGRGLVPTVEARRFYDGVEGMFIGLDRLQDLADTIRVSRGGTVSIGAIQSISTTELPITIGQMYRTYPEVQFTIHSRNTPGILDALQMRQIDLGIVGRDREHDGVESLFQISSPYVCLLPEDHPQSLIDGPVDLEMLADTENFVTFGGTYPDEMMSIDSGLSEKLRSRSRLSVANMPVAGAMVRETGVLAIADPFSAEQAVRSGGVVFRPLKQSLTYYVTVVCSSREQLSRPALEFVDLFATQMQDRIEYVRNLGR